MSTASDTEQSPAIQITNLTRKFRSKAALDDVTFNVPRGCVFGLLGESGAGKTTLMQHALGLRRAQEGSIRVLGLDPVAHPAEALAQIGYLSEDRDLPGWMKLEELMRYTNGLYPKWDPEFAETLREQFDLQLGQRIQTFSKGQKAKAGLLAALAHRPELLVLDEPSSGLDAVVRRHILSAVMRNVASEGRTVLFSSHLLDEVERVADYIAIIHRGRLLITGELKSVLKGHHKTVVNMPNADTWRPTTANAQVVEHDGTRATIVSVGVGDKLHAEIEQSGGQVTQETTPSLEEIFVARVGYSVLAEGNQE